MIFQRDGYFSEEFNAAYDACGLDRHVMSGEILRPAHVNCLYEALGVADRIFDGDEWRAHRDRLNTLLALKGLA